MKTGLPGVLDDEEPENVGRAVAKLGLKHVVITSVDRDDLADGGAEHFARTIRAIRRLSPGTSVEVLTPDFLRKDGALDVVMGRAARRVQPQSRDRAAALSLRASRRALFRVAAPARARQGTGARRFHQIRTHGRFGREPRGDHAGDDDLRAARVDFLTIGQYLQPTKKHAPLARFWTPEEFAGLEQIARAKGFAMVSASPLTRSSYHADSDFAALKAARQARA